MSERREMMDGFAPAHPELERYNPNDIFTVIGYRSYIKKNYGWSIGMAALFTNNWVYPIIISDSEKGLDYTVSDYPNRRPLDTMFEFEYEGSIYYACISYGWDNGYTVENGYELLNSNGSRYSHTNSGRVNAAKDLLNYYFYG